MSTLLVADRIVLGAGPSRTLAVREAAAVLVEGARIAWIGDAKDAPTADQIHRAPLLSAGLVDAHTHLAWAGSRHGEYAMRMAGADYVAIAAAGGGIVSSHRAVEAVTEDQIVLDLTARLGRMAAQGVTTVEVKSGYGLLPELELKQLRAIARAASRSDLPRVVPTFLALHALPPAFRERRADYVRDAVALVARVADERLAVFVDAYVDAHAFTVEEARALGQAAKSHGLGVRLHVGQFSDIGGAELTAELGGRSADHLEHLGPDGAAALAKAGVFAGLLPVASFTLKQDPPNVGQLREHGVRFFVASDANPGTAPTESLPLAMAFGVRSYGLTPEEAWIAATVHPALALDLPDVGHLAVGARADLVLWDLPHEHALVQPWGTPRASLVLRDGSVIHRA
jgi:imidazolonepropionase